MAEPDRFPPWHEETWTKVARMLAGDRTPHALLLHGATGIGKRLFAARIAAALLCTGEGVDGACGRCRACHLVQIGNHPDLRRVAPESHTAGIRIEAVRTLIDEFVLAADRARVAIIAPAETMNPGAANAFLKTLEEPAGRAVFLLVSDAPGMLLPTIRSRCRKIPMPPPSNDAALAWMRAHVDGATAERLLALSGGMPLTALEYGERCDPATIRTLGDGVRALFRGAAEPLEVAESWRGLKDARLVFAALFERLGTTARDRIADPDRLFAAYDDVLDTRRKWIEVPGLNESLIYEKLALRCAGLES